MNRRAPLFALAFVLLCSTTALLALAEPARAAQTTKCAPARTVCATAIAEAAVECDDEWGLRWCIAGGGAGGHGASPLGLAGTIAWSGHVCGGRSYGACGNAAYLADDCAWTGSDRQGCGTSDTHVVGTYTCFLCRASAYARVDSSAIAKSTVAGLAVETASATERDTTYRSHY